MHTRKLPLLLITFWLLALNVRAQNFPQNYFRNPLDSDIILAGSFGELRPNHFHTGLDIKTGGVEGLPVYAAADGYISHISISGYGYGNMLLVTHPNGYTTLYGHLQRFIGPVQNYARQQEYKIKKFALEQDVPPGLFPVKKGQQIGISGNTGGSRAPHLHFEIRENKTGHPVNPMLFGFPIEDTIPPTIYAIKAYVMDTSGFLRVTYTNGRQTLARHGQNIKIYVYNNGHGRCYLRNVQKIEGSGKIGFAIDANDFENNSYNTMGVYSIELCVDENRIYYQNMRSLDFDLKRFINAHVDYRERLHTGRWFQKSYILPGDVLPIYEGVKEDGIVQINAGNDYRMSYYLNDEHFNSSILIFHISSPAGPVNLPPITPEPYDTLIPFNKSVVFKRPGLIASFPANTFYQDIPLTYSEKPGSAKIYSQIYELGTPADAVNDYFRIAIKAEGLPEELISKAFIYSNKGFIGGEYKNGWIVTNSLTLGKFFITVDTDAPTLVPLNIRSGRNMSRDKNIRFIIKDNLAGIQSFNGYVDGQWVLFQYDPRISLTWYDFDSHVPPGPHTLTMEITDRCNNVRKTSYSFTR